MQVFDFAMQMEKDGEAFYRDLAGKTEDTGLKGILDKLAGAEVKHYETLRQIKESRAADMADGQLRQDAKNIFRAMMDEGRTLDLGSTELGLYRQAREIEQKSYDFYTREAEALESPKARELFYRIADEEKLHVDLIGSIIEFVERPEPGNWLENAEWYHSDEY
jgi:rubrerythrin